MPHRQTENLARKAGPPLEISSSLGHNSSGRTRLVLLVEDDSDLLLITSIFLKQLGCTVIAVPSGEAAIQEFEKLDGSIDVLITDLTMPKMNGKQLADTLWQRKPDLKVIFISGYCPDTVPERYSANFLQKPFGSEDLAGKLAEIMRSPAIRPSATATVTPGLHQLSRPVQ